MPVLLHFALCCFKLRECLSCPLPVTLGQVQETSVFNNRPTVLRVASDNLLLKLQAAAILYFFSLYYVSFKLCK